MHLPSLDDRAALIIAHPGHELRVHGWLQRARPRVFVMTDGSGRAGQSRLLSTTRVLAEVGAEPGSIYGRLIDRELYAALLNRHFDLFIKLVDELVDFFRREQIEYVVGDAAEGYNSAHDVCRLLTNAAVKMMGLRYQRHVSNFDFLVVGSPDEHPATGADGAIRIRLDDDVFSRKIATAYDYSPKLAADIDAVLKGDSFQGINRVFETQMVEQVGVGVGQTTFAALKFRPRPDAQVRESPGGIALDEFRIECLRPVSDHGPVPDLTEIPPYYEIYGEKVVAAGGYQQVIRYRDHIRPLADALREHVERGV